MKWMGWGPEDLAAADPDIVLEITRCINEEQDEIRRASNR